MGFLIIRGGFFGFWGCVLWDFRVFYWCLVVMVVINGAAGMAAKEKKIKKVVNENDNFCFYSLLFFFFWLWLWLFRSS